MDFWKSAGLHLVERDENGWLTVTPDYLRAYITLPQVHPVDESCAAEHALFEKLMEDPFAAVEDSELERIADADAAGNYRILLRFRDHLARHKTVEAAYAALFTGDPISIPPLFIDQMVHLILRNILSGVEDPFRLRAAELFFREQVATVDDDQLMLADQEIVEMRSKDGFGGLGQLLAQAGTPAREVALEVMTEENQDLYWQRSDRFDMAVDFRFTQPAPDALGRVIEAWIDHFLKVKTRVHAVKSIRDQAWSWHVGLDQEATRILNALYEGEELDESDLFNILSLYRLDFLNAGDVVDSMQGKPVYLAVAMNKARRVVLKPQNLLTNLPIRKR
jgi:hypothetical protein